jgi:hypothetical protein
MAIRREEERDTNNSPPSFSPSPSPLSLSLSLSLFPSLSDFSLHRSPCLWIAAFVDEQQFSSMKGELASTNSFCHHEGQLDIHAALSSAQGNLGIHKPAVPSMRGSIPVRPPAAFFIHEGQFGIHTAVFWFVQEH